MDRSRQGLTRNESLRSETPTSYLIFKKHTPPDLSPKAFNSFRRAEESPSAGRTGAGGPTLGLGAFSSGFPQVRGARRVRGNVSWGWVFCGHILALVMKWDGCADSW